MVSDRSKGCCAYAATENGPELREHSGQQMIRCFGGYAVFYAHQPHTRRMG
jgi:hypothetical protein